MVRDMERLRREAREPDTGTGDSEGPATTPDSSIVPPRPPPTTAAPPPLEAPSWVVGV